MASVFIQNFTFDTQDKLEMVIWSHLPTSTNKSVEDIRVCLAFKNSSLVEHLANFVVKPWIRLLCWELVLLSLVFWWYGRMDSVAYWLKLLVDRTLISAKVWSSCLHCSLSESVRLWWIWISKNKIIYFKLKSCTRDPRGDNIRRQKCNNRVACLSQVGQAIWHAHHVSWLSKKPCDRKKVIIFLFKSLPLNIRFLK